ncbi:MAG TPA: OmpA family protein [Bryobacteraceae bacterium]|nr:OmpA family protein [Bryobacteraceae bacterium]
MFNHGRTTAALILPAAAFMVIGTTGCATKKHVRQTVAPVEARVSSAEKRNQEQQAALGELENGLSRTDERAMDAERKASAAGQAAQTAHTRADGAFSRADNAYGLAESTRSRLSELSENIDNYKLVTAENVLFGLGKHQLTKDAEAQLDAAVAQLQGSKNYVLEIQGFTDATGSSTTNLELSRKRADSVVRYLTVKHNVPLRKINVLGVGEDDPNADNKTREGRKQARRVEMRVFALDLGGSSTNAGMATGGGAAQSSGQGSTTTQQTPAARDQAATGATATQQ